ncbi:MAG: flagellar hook-basal body protein [Phycisphaerae bacterium]
MTNYGLWLSTAGMKINDHRQTLLANNMANVDTVGFKHDLAVMRQRPVEVQEDSHGLEFQHPVLDGLAGGVNVQPVFHAFKQGPLIQTDKPLDIAIRGEGFFAVTDGEETRYTRNGQFVVNPEGELTLAADNGRWKVLDEGGQQISVNPDAGRIALFNDGTVRQDNQIVTNLGLYTTDDMQTLRKVGQNTFRSTADMRPIQGQFAAGNVEGSSFNIMNGLASMIEAQRAYQMNANLIRIQDELTGRAITNVGRVA